MRENQKKFGWTAKGIVGLIFAPLGLFFLVLGVVLWQCRAGHQPEDPDTFLYVFGGEGLLFLAVGGGLLYADVKNRRIMRRAYEDGHCVMAQIAGVQVRTNVNTAKGHPRVVECHYTDPDTGVTHILFSRYLNFDPTGMFTSMEVPVYVDRETDKPVFVDIDAVLPPTEVHGN